jgi:glutathione peroxidase-family protein
MMHELKINGCSMCGYSEYDSALEFHHVEPLTKKFHVTKCRLLEYPENKFIDEFHKCVLLCANCHRAVEEISRRK